MKFNCSLLLIPALLLYKPANAQGQKKPAVKKPNIIFILTDDLGYGDVGVFWQNQRAKAADRSQPWTYTPNLDKMAMQGAMLTQAYAAAPVCAPSRASILTGLSQGHARVRDNQFDKDLADNYTLGNVLQKAGYATAAIGKWGLQGDARWTKDGKDWIAHPLNRGFDYYYGYMRHEDGHEHYPKEGLYRKQKQVWDNRTDVTQQLDKCYTADLWTAAAKKWIAEHQKGKNGDQPFFMYLAYDTPHAVLELPTGPYPAGGGLKGGVQWLGQPGHMINTATGTIDSYTYPDYANATYDDDNNKATPEVPWPDTYKRYASSVRRIDDNIGDLFKLLADLKIDDNTLVIFSSDNGPSIEAYLPKPHVDYKANFFGSFGPFDGIKRDELEGGERMPVIARWPGHIPAGKPVNTPTISYDWLPTMADAAGLPAPANTDGRSILPALTGKGVQKDGLIYSEYFEPGKSPNYKEYAPNNRMKQRNQMQMIRMGNLVGLRYNVKSADDDFAIFDVVKDTHQANNLAAAMPQLQKQMKEMVLQVRRPDTSAQRPYDDALVPASNTGNTKQGLVWKGYAGKYPWIPDVTDLAATATGQCNTIDTKTLKPGCDTYLFEGYIKVPEDGEYTFYLSSSGKAFLRIHDASVIDEDYGYQPNTEKEGSMKLKAGLHPIRIYYQGKPGGALNFEWKSDVSKKMQVPANAFFIGGK
ncbi:sulfatase-like hydrolase/transferase [Mucilaginibacter mali]|uniref:Sulfatase-like hydrolase/transferase n=1 Tax=Mucilaginibacter mali TaxID=2740462 RepID=A0A7D4TVR6_9SPHI|nr:sulfatase-like hydrolase/transferase [Mucilaginibacter mali]QKJ28777.1 sulfatase-like hydrolase/transferase [Mucilaginibacter mali]